MKKFIYFIPAFLLFFASCASTKSVYQLTGEWSVVNLNGQNITPSEATPYLGFDINENRLYGFTGCNRLTGNLMPTNSSKAKQNSDTSLPRVCSLKDDKFEQPFLEALNKVKTSEVNGEEILLKDEQGKVIITLKKKKLISNCAKFINNLLNAHTICLNALINA